MSLPVWIKKEIRSRRGTTKTVSLLRSLHLHTVCEEARCPNLGRCFSSGTATFLILGKVCTRNCRFCAITSGVPDPPDPNEPENVALAAESMGLEYVVITSVTRDDLPDGGAEHFKKTILKVREKLPHSKIEVLIPDFKGDLKALDTVLSAQPDVLNHNIETVPSLYKKVRPLANYETSLKIIHYAHKMGFITKSGLMLGLGETMEQVKNTLKDLKHSGCDILTLGQYLQPSFSHLPVSEYVHPEVFEELKEFALSIGFSYVVSAPLVRSSFMAKEAYLEVVKWKKKELSGRS